jgi:hypothetical protein
VALKSNELHKILHNEIGETILRLGFKKSKPSLSYSKIHTDGYFKIQFICARMAVNVVNEGSYFQTYIGITTNENDRVDGLINSVRLTDSTTYEERLEIQNCNATVCDKRLEYWKEWAKTQPEPIRTNYQTWEPPWSRMKSPPEKRAANLNHNNIEYLDEMDVREIGKILRKKLSRNLDIAKAIIESKSGPFHQKKI